MAVRYFIRYFDVVNIEHRLNIYDDNYVGESVQVDGKVEITYSETDNSLEAIRGQGLRVELEADANLTFNDLWSEEEKTFRVEYKRDDIILFQGWLNPEGFFESFVNTNWLVSFDCVDGLGFLTNLSFVEDETGYPIKGRRSYLNILSLALLRTGLYQPINTSVNIFYDGLDESLDIFNNVYANTERYRRDDDETIMSCEEVLRDILEPLGAVLTSLGGEWYIYKPNELFLNTNVSFFRNTYLGEPLVDKKDLDFSLLIGSNADDITPFHCGGNQTIKNTSSVGAYRVNYKYGLATDLLQNPDFYSDNGTRLIGWGIGNSELVVPKGAGEYGVTLYGTDETGILLPILISESVDVVLGVDLQFTLKYFSSYTGILVDPPVLEIVVQLTGTTGNYYLTSNGDWTQDPANSRIQKEFLYYQENSIFIDAGTVPEAGTVNVFFYRPYVEVGTANVFLTKCSLINTAETPDDLLGEFHTGQRTTKPSSKIESIKTVATGDNVSDIYEGTLYKNDANTPTETWHRKGITESKPILQIMVEETLRMNQLPSRVFSGDLFGYFNYLSVITINGLDGLFMPIKYTYDTKSNVISAELRQIYGGELVDIDYKKTFDYGNVVEPTII